MSQKANGATDSGDGALGVLEVRSVFKAFGGKSVLRDVSMSLTAGEIRALVGLNGSGKSTLVRILVGALRADRGDVLLNGRALSAGSPQDTWKRGVRVVHQDLALVSRLSVLDNLMLGSQRDHGVIVRRRREAAEAEAALAVLECGVALDRLVADCTPVERTLVALCKSLGAADGLPRLLILDEPTATLSASGVDRLFGVLRDLAAKGVAILFIGHRLHEISQLVDTVSVLRDGRVVADFPAPTMDPDAVLDAMIGSKDLLVRPTASTAEVPPGTRPSVAGSGAVAGVPEPSRHPLLELRELAIGGTRGISTRVETGIVVGFAGAEGSGREKLGAVLAGLDEPLSGTVHVGESVITSAGRARAAGLVVVPNYRLPGAGVMQFSIRENMTLTGTGGRRQLLTHRGSEGVAADEWIGRLEIKPADPQAHYGLLSGGNKQKVMIARGILSQPHILVLDEPTAGVDPAAREIIYATVRSLVQSGVIVVVISNDFLDLQICDRVVVFSSAGEAVEIDFASAGLTSLQDREREILHAML